MISVVFLYLSGSTLFEFSLINEVIRYLYITGAMATTVLKKKEIQRSKYSRAEAIL